MGIDASRPVLGVSGQANSWPRGFSPSYAPTNLFRYRACADPDFFFRVVPTLTTFFCVFFFLFFPFFLLVDEGRKDQNIKIPLSGPSSARQRNAIGVSLACQWHPYIEYWLGGFVIFRGAGPVFKAPFSLSRFKVPVHPGLMIRDEPWWTV